MKNSKTDPNKSDRILSFLQSREFTEAELKTISGAGNYEHTPRVTNSKVEGADGIWDITYTW